MERLAQIQQAVETIINLRPAYHEILDFYKTVFRIQEENLCMLNCSTIVIDSDKLKLKQENELPLIDPSEFIIDMASAGQIFEKICNVTETLAPGLASGAGSMKIAVSEGRLGLASLFTAILSNNEKQLIELSTSLNIPLDELYLFSFLCMSPSIRTCAKQLESYFSIIPELKKGYCPICGSRPNLASLDQEGRQFLHCSLCSHHWNFPRIECVFCSNTDKETQHYFYNEEEKEYRVNLE
jgi:FdhE protein